MKQSLYQRVLGERFHQLPLAVQQMHGLIEGERLVQGVCQIEGAENRIAAIFARLAGLPCAGENLPVSVHFSVQNGVETWLRHFAGKPMVSWQWQRQTMLVERLRFVRFYFAIDADAAGLQLRLMAMRVAGVRVPAWLFPRISAREYQQEGVFYFDVSAAIKGIGRLVHYRGYLQ